MYTHSSRIPCVLLVVCLVAVTTAGAATHVNPPSASRTDVQAIGRIAAEVMPAVDVDALLREDEENRTRPGIPFRVGQPQSTDLDPANSGVWEDLPEGGRLWRLKVRSPGALWSEKFFGSETRCTRSSFSGR